MGLKLNDLAEVKDLVKSRQNMSSKKLCFQGLKSGHCAVHSSSCTCFKCNWKHYISSVAGQLQQKGSRTKRKGAGFSGKK